LQCGRPKFCTPLRNSAHKCALALLVVGLALALVASSPAQETRLNNPAQLWQAFVCIHRHEGSWTAATGNGFYGGLQFDGDFERSYGSEFLSMWGHANRWPSAVQITVAMRAYASRGFSPWPNTARVCGLR
jgi:hypothetical protein